MGTCSLTITFLILGKCVVVLDGAKCHIDIEIAREAEKQDVILFCLPSNTTHELQPLDKSVFKPLEDYWDTELTKYWSSLPANERTLSKYQFGRVFTPAWDQAATQSNIKSGNLLTYLHSSSLFLNALHFY